MVDFILFQANLEVEAARGVASDMEPDAEQDPDAVVAGAGKIPGKLTFDRNMKVMQRWFTARVGLPVAQLWFTARVGLPVAQLWICPLTWCLSATWYLWKIPRTFV